MAMQYDIIRDMVTINRVDFDAIIADRDRLAGMLTQAENARDEYKGSQGVSLQDYRLLAIEKERFEQRVADVVTFCLELLATVQGKTTWTHSQRNAFDLLLIAELEKLVIEDVNDIPF